MLHWCRQSIKCKLESSCIRLMVVEKLPWRSILRCRSRDWMLVEQVLLLLHYPFDSECLHNIRNSQAKPPLAYSGHPPIDPDPPDFLTLRMLRGVAHLASLMWWERCNCFFFMITNGRRTRLCEGQNHRIESYFALKMECVMSAGASVSCLARIVIATRGAKTV